MPWPHPRIPVAPHRGHELDEKISSVIDDQSVHGRAVRHGGDAPGVGTSSDHSPEGKLHPRADADLEWSLRWGGPKIVLPVPDHLLIQARLERRRRRMGTAEHSGGEMADDAPLRVFDGE